MKTTIPAIRGKIGETIYYSTNFTFKLVADLVKRVDDELHTAHSLNEIIQRELSNNYISIKDYITSTPDHFFNSLVLAVYDGDPQWTEIRFDLGDDSYPNVGILSFTGDEKIFPVDGQHRVEGIKNALQENEQLENETIGVLLIGHSKTADGMKKTRRIFSTLNRYAKPVKLGDIIALDEDDIVAITTREQLEKNILFAGERIKETNSKSIPVTDKSSFTTLITLYECHKELFKVFKHQKDNRILGAKELNNYLRFRPKEEEITDFDKFVSSFWEEFTDAFPEIREFVSDNSDNAAERYRPVDSGGNILFRPVSLGSLIHVISSIAIHHEKGEIKKILSRFAQLNREINSELWTSVLWDPNGKKMIIANKKLAELLMRRYYRNSILSVKERDELANRYATVFAITPAEAHDRINRLFEGSDSH